MILIKICYVCKYIPLIPALQKKPNTHKNKKAKNIFKAEVVSSFFNILKNVSLR